MKNFIRMKLKTVIERIDISFLITMLIRVLEKGETRKERLRVTNFGLCKSTSIRL